MTSLAELRGPRRSQILNGSTPTTGLYANNGGGLDPEPVHPHSTLTRRR
jgi:hypothetical protein